MTKQRLNEPIQLTSAVDFMLSEIFYSLFITSLWDPTPMATLDPRGMDIRIYIGDHYGLLYKKFRMFFLCFFVH